MGNLADGYLVDGIIVYNAIFGGIASKGFRVSLPFLADAGDSVLSEYATRFARLLRSLRHGQRMQFHWGCDGDYSTDLLNFQSCTESYENAYVREARSKRFCYYWKRMEQKELRREEFFIFPIVNLGEGRHFLSGRGTTESAARLSLHKAADELKDIGNSIRSVLGSEATITELGDTEHYKLFKRLFCPYLGNQVAREGFLENHYNLHASIRENCLNSDIALLPGSIRFGSRYHSFFAISRWPKFVCPGAALRLTDTGIVDYRIVVNVVPLEKETVISKERRELKRLMGERVSSAANVDRDVPIEKKTAKIQQLQGGLLSPFSVEYIFHTWAATEEELRAKERQLIVTLNNMDGAEEFTTNFRSRLQCLLGNTFYGYFEPQESINFIYAQDDYLSCLIPWSSSFDGALNGAEALFDGDQSNIVGIKSFQGDSPQHTLLFGMTGAGKSVFVQDFLEQSAAYFDFTAIIEEGLSYEQFTKNMGYSPILIEPSGEQTINYFDTQGNPLTPEHLALATTLVASFAGNCTDSEEQQLRIAQLAQYINQAYDDKLQSFEKKHADKLPYIRKFACAIEYWRRKAREGQSFIEAHADLTDRIQSNDAEAINFVEKTPELEAIDFTKNEDTRHLYRSLVFSFFRPEEFPRHSDLVELMLGCPRSSHNREKVFNLANRLSAWCRTGTYGRLFDGPSNVDLNAPMVHFELGRIPENLVEMKAACGILLTGAIRQHILSMPRSKRKRILFEEVARFLSIPGGEKIVSEAYAQLRKFRCQAIAIVQQYAQFKHSAIRPVLIGNSKQYWIMRQNDRRDLDELAEDIGLSSVAKEKIQGFLLPEHLDAKNRYSSIFYYSPNSKPIICGALRNVQLN